MLQILAEALIERAVLKIDTEIDASYETWDLAGLRKISAIDTFMILKFGYNTNKELVFEAASTKDGSRRSIFTDSILRIDGMSPEDLARAFDLKPDGTKYQVGKKRGRKPKDRTNVGQCDTVSFSDSDTVKKRTRRKGPNHRKFAA